MAKRAKKSAKTGDPTPEPIEPVVDAASETETQAPVPTTGIVDPIGDVSSGEAYSYLGGEESIEAEAVVADESAHPEVAADEEVADDLESDDEAEFVADARPPAKLERLQKILSQAGVASRRKAEEMIEQGRVQVNGTVVTALGTKADAGRDHIRVDGKLLRGAERLRYFVLNKPKGFVTTVKDPEGRPTVMKFFEKMRERLYPVGRLDYQSEGLLLVTNDGDLANRLTKAGSGVEKTYLVKVAGQPSEQELEVLRGGVAIERGKPGSPKVRTAPARIRQVRQGDNPWYEVVLIEGRNRELRKMFSAIGHFVEKIRRVGYGPLILDQEPGNLRELEPEELASLRLAAEGKLRTPKAKEVRRRNLADAQLPTVSPKPSRPRPGQTFESRRPAKPFEAPKFEKGSAAPEHPSEFRPRSPFRQDEPFRQARPAGEGFRPAAGRTGGGTGKFGPPRSESGRPAWKKDDRTPRPPERFSAGATGKARPSTAKPLGDRPAAGRGYGGKPAGRPFAGRPAEGRSAWKKPGSDRPPFKRPAATYREPPVPAEDFTEKRPSRLRIDAVESDRPEPRRVDTRPAGPARAGGNRPPFDRARTGKPGFGKPSFDRPRPVRPNSDRPKFDGPRAGKPGFSKPSFDRPRPDRPRFDRPRPDQSGSGQASSDRPRFEKSRFDRSGSGRSGSSRSGGAGSGQSRPPRGESGLGRPFTTSSGKPRAGGARPSSKPFKPGEKSGSRPKSGGFSKFGQKGPGFKGKPGGKRSGPPHGGKKRG
jgi:23S rRNA pseudouridine2605 synthase